MSKQLNIEHLRHQIEDAGGTEDRGKQAQKTLAVLRQASVTLKKRVTTIRSQFQDEYSRRILKETDSDPFVIGTEHYIALIAMVGAAVVMIMDIMISAVLSKTWLNLPPAGALLAGCAVGVILSLMCKAGVVFLARAHDVQAPRVARRKLEGFAVAGFVINVALIVTVLSSRNPSESIADIIFTLTGISLGVMGVTLPIFAGALMALAHDLDWSYRHERLFQEAETELTEVYGFRAWCGDKEVDSEITGKQVEAEQEVKVGHAFSGGD